MPLSDNLVAAYELNEASGNAVDGVGALDLTDQNTVGSGTGLIYGAARDFEADTTEYFSITDNATLSIGDVDATWETWVKPETTTGFPVVLSKGPSDDREYILYLATDVPNWQVGSGTVAWTGASLSAGNWYQIICWHDSVNNLLGVTVNDGTPATASHALGGTDSTNDFQIGAAPTQTLYWDGLIGPCRLWKRMLTSLERTELYNAGAGRTLAYITGAASGNRRRRLLICGGR